MCLVQLPVRHIFCYTAIIVLVIVFIVFSGMKLNIDYVLIVLSLIDQKLISVHMIARFVLHMFISDHTVRPRIAFYISLLKFKLMILKFTLTVQKLFLQTFVIFVLLLWYMF